jgi:ketosteroid isomerase-like protein
MDESVLTLEQTHLDLARRYLQALADGATGPRLAAFFTPDVEQREYPNRLTPHGAVRDLAALLEGAERGQAILAAQTYVIERALASGSHVALEVTWTGTLAIQLGALNAGDTMTAHFAVFLDFRDGKIAAQRNYDCFEPW